MQAQCNICSYTALTEKQWQEHLNSTRHLVNKDIFNRGMEAQVYQSTKQIADLRASLTAAQAQNAKLREALKEIANPDNWVNSNGNIVWNDFQGNEFHTEHAMGIAGNALEEK